MKKILLLPIIWAFVCSFSAQAKVSDLAFFQGSMSQLQEMARQSRVPYMVYFYVLECDPCRKMQKESFNNEQLIRYAEDNYLLYRVDGLDFLSGIDIAKKYGVRSYPTTIIFGPDGDVRKREEGFISGAELTRMLMKHQKPGDRRPDSRVVVTTNNVSQPSTLPKNTPPASSTTSSTVPDWVGVNNNGSLYNTSLPESNSWSSNTTNGQLSQGGVDKRDYVNEYLNYRSNNSGSTMTYDAWRSQRGNTRGSSESAISGNSDFDNPYSNNQYGESSQSTDNSFPATTSDDGSFLARVDMAQAGQGGLPDYVWDGNRQVARSTLSASTQLYFGADGQWHVSRTTTAEGSAMRMRGASPEQPTETIYAVPGFGDYAPKKLKSETFGLLISEFDAIVAAKEGLQAFEAENPGIPVWVFAERKGSSTIYKMAMGVYSTPDAASTDAMARGADWDDIRIVQLNP
jgi:thiol-disulfide isomerase/thioredoxin